MPVLSAFTPCGMLAMSSEPSRAETIYKILYDQLAKAFDLSVGTHAEAMVYAMAMLIARGNYTLIRAGNQVDPNKAYDLIPLLEQDYLIVPGFNDTVPMRAATIAARMLLSRGAVAENIIAGLRLLLGADFIAYRTFTTSEAVQFPTIANWTAAGTNKANPTSTQAAPKLLKLVDPVTLTGVPTTVTYTNLDASAGEVTLAAGDVIMAQPENTGLSERVTITSVAGTGAARTLTATFTHSHDIGATLTTGNWPYWWSTQRYALVILSVAASIDATKRRIANEFMARCVRGVSQWAIVQAVGVGTTGAFIINTSPLGATTINATTFTPSP